MCFSRTPLRPGRSGLLHPGDLLGGGVVSRPGGRAHGGRAEGASGAGPGPTQMGPIVVKMIQSENNKSTL